MNAEADPFPPPPRPVHHRANVATALGLVGGAVAAGALTGEPDQSWYDSLNKPDWQPPRVVFPVAWSLLYTSIAADAAAVLNELDRRGDTEGAAEFRKALAGNMVLNGAWSWVFFRANSLPVSFVGAAVLAANSICLARRAGRVSRKYGLAMAPYAAWTSFATVLAGELWRRNSAR